MSAKTIYDQPVMNPNWTEKEILDYFIHNRDFAFTWFGLMTKDGKGRTMPIEQQEKILVALREYITIISDILGYREAEFDLDNQ